MTVIPKKDTMYYGTVKKMCCVERPSPNQVVTLKLLGKPDLRTVATKVAIQMSAKLGATPWTVRVPLSNLMVVGFDVYHDTAKNAYSFGALVASLNKDFSRFVDYFHFFNFNLFFVCSRYYSAVERHERNTEIGDKIGVMMHSALKAYKDVNGTLPNSIVFYRYLSIIPYRLITDLLHNLCCYYLQRRSRTWSNWLDRQYRTESDTASLA